jgi:hypothetical protein
LRFERIPGGVRATLPLPAASATDLDVTKLEGELLIGTGAQRRSLPLPRHVVPMALTQVRFEDGTLTVHFAAGEGA